MSSASFISGVQDTLWVMARERAEPAERLQSLERGLHVLDHVNRLGSATSSQVAVALGLTRSTAHRMLGVLKDLGLLRCDPASGQYFLTAGVLELSRGFRDEPWIERVAEPAMREWSTIHHWPLVLVTPLAGVLTVRASTDHESPISIDRLAPGAIVPMEGSTAGALLHAYVQGVIEPSATSLPGDAVKSPHWRSIRRRGYVASPTACYTGARISVPLLVDRQYLGNLSMRCLPECIASRRELTQWVASLKELAARIVEGSRSALHPLPCRTS
jgi:IclR family transcriptional regulator, mhp operon transcriptional activator